MALLTCLFFISNDNFLLGETPGKKTKDPLTPDERAWFKQNRNNIVASVYTDYAPYEFIDSNGNPAGISEDILCLLEKKLRISFKRKNYRLWKNIIRDARRGRVSIIKTIHPNPERRRYLFFTKTYMRMPNVTIIRDDWPGDADLASLKGKRVAVVEDYASYTYLEKNYPDLKLVKVETDAVGITRVALNNVDAYIMDLAVVTHLIKKTGITNLRVGRPIDFDWELSMGVTRTMPRLNDIIQKGISMIKPEEIDAIKKKWINAAPLPFYKTKGFRMAIGFTSAFFLIIIAMFFTWNRFLTREVEKKTRELQESHDTLEEKVRERTAELTAALNDIKELKGLIPICANCKKIRNDDGYWSQVDEYLTNHTDIMVSHGLCPSCTEKLYGDKEWYKKAKKKQKKIP